jgi:hypothetical protein
MRHGNACDSFPETIPVKPSKRSSAGAEGSALRVYRGRIVCQSECKNGASECWRRAADIYPHEVSPVRHEQPRGHGCPTATTPIKELDYCI